MNQLATAALEAALQSETDALWYKDAVIYQLHVKAFYDSNNDGIGDFKGLTAKLDYIQDLGVNAIWLLPFYPSPLKDDGYDVADYHNVHPQYGTIADFKAFVHEAQRRGLKVITELVVNHTSDQHPWFQAARRAPAGSRKRDYYVWSDTDQKYKGTRIIFTDTETSNWAWDPVAKAYYWHRFFSHQPDLNFDNPHVLQAVFRTMRFWLDMGVDGFRLDAIPYLIEREGTTNENLPETHVVLKQIRALIDKNYPNKLLLAEANMWPEDVRPYFGDGDECHMAFHFPLMPRMYMAIAQEDRHPLVEIMAQTPDIPDICQWAIFLRNHDELTLEMVTSRERDYMYRMYAAGPAGAHQPRHPPAPRAAHGERPRPHQADEQPAALHAGLADRLLRRRDRHGRQHLPRRPQRRAHADAVEPGPQRRLLARRSAAALPAADHGPGLRLRGGERRGAAARPGVAAQLDEAHARHAQGEPRVRPRPARASCGPATARCSPTCASYGDEAILCVANLSRTAQPVELDLQRFKGRVPVEMLGRTSFPPIGELPYLLTLPAHGVLLVPPRHRRAAAGWHQDMLVSEERRCWCSSTAGRASSATRSCPGASAWPSSCAQRLENRGAARVSSPRSAGMRRRAKPSSGRHRDHSVIWDVGGLSWLVAMVAGEGLALLPAARARLGGGRGARARARRRHRGARAPAGERRRARPTRSPTRASAATW